MCVAVCAAVCAVSRHMCVVRVCCGLSVAECVAVCYACVLQCVLQCVQCQDTCAWCVCVVVSVLQCVLQMCVADLFKGANNVVELPALL